MYTTDLNLQNALSILEAVGGDAKAEYLYRTSNRFVFRGYVALSSEEAVNYVNVLSLYELNKTAERSKELNELDADASS